MLAYAFMQRSLIAGIFLGILIPLVGVTVVLRRLSMVGDALSHSSLAGVAGGLIAGVNPVAGAAVACLTGALCVEGVRARFQEQAELAVAVVLAAGIGLAGVLAGFVPNAANFSSFLFGSILTVSQSELVGVIVICLAAGAFCLLCRRGLFLAAYDEMQARVCSIPVVAINLGFTVVLALLVAVASRTVGSLMVSSLMVVPVACALQLARSWRQTCVISCVVGLLSSVAGLTISFYAGLKPGGTIVLLSVATLLVILLVQWTRRRLSHLRYAGSKNARQG